MGRHNRAHANHITINKLRMNRQITKQDLDELERLLFTASEVGSRERFEQVFGHQQSLGTFIRGLVGLDREAATEAFGEFLHNTTYSATQIRFIDQVRVPDFIFLQHQQEAEIDFIPLLRF